jgi:hypothetical protein
MESLIFMGFTVLIVYVIYWSIKNDDVQDYGEGKKKFDPRQLGKKPQNKTS